METQILDKLIVLSNTHKTSKKILEELQNGEKVRFFLFFDSFFSFRMTDQFILFISESYQTLIAFFFVCGFVVHLHRLSEQSFFLLFLQSSFK